MAPRLSWAVAWRWLLDLVGLAPLSPNGADRLASANACALLFRCSWRSSERKGVGQGSGSIKVAETPSGCRRCHFSLSAT